MEQKSLRPRLAAIGMLFAVCLIAFFLVMFDTQIVHGAEYRERSVRTNTATETVEASRGIITDRNGKVLVSNVAIYTLEFDPSLVPGDELNDALARLAALLQAQGIGWIDLLPVSHDAPYSYALTNARAKALFNFLTERDLLDGEGRSPEELADILPASAVLTRLRSYYGVDSSLDHGAARLLVGLRYSLDRTAASGGTSYVFASDVPVSLISLVKDGDYAGVRVGQSSKRVYETDNAAHILGRVTKIPSEWLDEYLANGYAMNDLIGRDGAEYAFEQYLRGTDGRRVITMNAEGKVTGEVWSTEPQPGGTVALTIDDAFQGDVERILANTTAAMTASDHISRGAAAAVVQVGTGEVLALASYPTYSLKTFNEDYATLNDDPLQPMYNRATMGTYAPGSTFKPLTAIAALETGTITPQTRIRTLGQYHYYDRTYNCWIYTTNHGNHGTINVTQAITVSCNYFFYDVGRMTGISTLARYAAAFGLGEPTGIEIPERTGAMTTPDYVNSLRGLRWSDGLTLQAAIGQANSTFTPLQLANYIATLAGGGTRYNAHLLKDVRDNTGAKLLHTYDEPPAETVSIGERNLRAVLQGMRDLVTSGSVRAYFKDCVVDAAAKTGTAQTGGKGSTSNGVFVAFAPYDDPQIAVAIVIEKGGSGGALASTAADILNAYFTAAEPDAAGENMLVK